MGSGLAGPQQPEEDLMPERHEADHTNGRAEILSWYQASKYARGD
jgi:hypothetical protein